MREEVDDGTPVVDLPMTEVDVPDPRHLRRSVRYPNTIDIEPIAAVEAALDIHGLTARDMKSRTGEGDPGHRVLADGALSAALAERTLRRSARKTPQQGRGVP